MSPETGTRADVRRTGDMVLDVRSVDVDLGSRPVLGGVDLRLSSGELVGLIGPNGAGKTTLLRAVLGAIPIRSGRITVGGVPPAQARGTVGYVPQRHEFAWEFPVSVEQAVMTGRVHRIGWLRRPGASDHAAVRGALERVGLLDLARRPIGELSGGQRQRVLVARALALEPHLLLLDEPFTGLDVPTQTVLSALVSELRAQGGALLMTTHDIAAAAEVCTRVCLLNRTVVADGPVEELRDPDTWLRAFGATVPDRFLHRPESATATERGRGDRAGRPGRAPAAGPAGPA